MTHTCPPEPRGVVEGTKCPLTRFHYSDILRARRDRSWGLAAYETARFHHTPRRRGNITGMSGQNTDIAGKRVELLREVFPGLKTIGRPAGNRELRF
jgi:hypothetical protein